MKISFLTLIVLLNLNSANAAQKLSCGSILGKNGDTITEAANSLKADGDSGDFSIYPMPVPQTGEYLVKLLKSFSDLTSVHVTILYSRGVYLDQDFQVDKDKQEVLMQIDKSMDQGSYTMIVNDPGNNDNANRHSFIVH